VHRRRRRCRDSEALLREFRRRGLTFPSSLSRCPLPTPDEGSGAAGRYGRTTRDQSSWSFPVRRAGYAMRLIQDHPNGRVPCSGNGVFDIATVVRLPAADRGTGNGHRPTIVARCWGPAPASRWLIKNLLTPGSPTGNEKSMGWGRGHCLTARSAARCFRDERTARPTFTPVLLNSACGSTRPAPAACSPVLRSCALAPHLRPARHPGASISVRPRTQNCGRPVYSFIKKKKKRKRRSYRCCRTPPNSRRPEMTTETNRQNRPRLQRHLDGPGYDSRTLSVTT